MRVCFKCKIPRIGGKSAQSRQVIMEELHVVPVAGVLSVGGVYDGHTLLYNSVIA